MLRPSAHAKYDIDCWCFPDQPRSEWTLTAALPRPSLKLPPSPPPKQLAARLGVLDYRPGDGDSLLLPAAELDAALSHPGVELLGQGLDEGERVGRLCSQGRCGGRPSGKKTVRGEKERRVQRLPIKWTKLGSRGRYMEGGTICEHSKRWLEDTGGQWPPPPPTRRRHQLLLACVSLADADVVGDGAVKQQRLLAHQAHLRGRGDVQRRRAEGCSFG